MQRHVKAYSIDFHGFHDMRHIALFYQCCDARYNFFSLGGGQQ